MSTFMRRLHSLVELKYFLSDEGKKTPI